MTKRLFALLLVLTLVVSMLPVGVLAESTVAAIDSSAALIEAMQNGGSIKLTADIVLEGAAQIPAGKTVVLDLNGKTISSTNEKYYINNASELTIVDSREGGKDGRIIMTPASESASVYGLYNTGKLTIEGGKITSTTKKKNVYAVFSEAPSVTINGGTFEATLDGNVDASAYAIAMRGDTSGSSVATINGGTFIATSKSMTGNNRCAAVYASGDNSKKITITINDGIFEGNREGHRGASAIRFKDSPCGATIVIKGGTFRAGSTTKTDIEDRMFAGSAGNLTITGGTFTYDSNIFTAARKATITGGTFVKFDGTKNDISKYLSEGYTQEEGAVAKGVDSFEALVAAVQEDGTVRLTADIALTEKVTVPAGKIVVLDLNGKTISSVNEGYYIDNAGTLTINDSRGGDKDGEIKMTPASESAAVSALKNTGKLTINGGKITTTTKSKTAQAISSESSSVTINGGSFEANYDSTGGSSAYTIVLLGDTSGSSVATINGGTFIAKSRSTANSRCAAVFANCDNTKKITITINGGTFEGSRDGYRGASVIRFRDTQCGATVVINDGTFTAGKTAAGATDDRMFAGSLGALTIKGGTFTYDTKIFTDARKATITGGTFVKFDGTKNDISSYVSTGYEQADNGQVIEKGVAPSHSHKLCNETSCADHAELVFEAWTSKTSLPTTAGNYYLTEDVKLSAVCNLKADVNLCLNGHAITAPANERSFALNAGYTLSVTDCGETGKITGGVRNWGGVINVNPKATFNLFGGSLTGNTNKDAGKADGQGGAVYLSAGTSATEIGGTFNMYGGTITKNTAYKGGAIYAGKYTFTNIYGGSITENTANNSAGAILLGTSATFNMTGGSITDNVSAIEGGAITVTNSSVSVSGNAVINGNKAGQVTSNLYLKTGVISVGAMGATAQIGISVVTPSEGLVLSAALNGADVSGKFTSDDDNYTISVKDDKLILKEKVFHKHNLDDSNAHDAELNFLPWESTTTLPTTAGNYYLTCDVQLKSVWNLKANVNLCLNGFTITAPANDRTVALNAGYTLSITDHEDLGKITGGVRNWGGVINVNAGSTFNMYGGQLTGNTNKTPDGGDGQGGAVYLSAASGSNAGGVFNMYGGSINNNVAYRGGAIYMLKGSTFNMYGGVITENTGNNRSGAIWASGATINLYDGEITNNSGKSSGGAITLISKANMTMHSGKINYNKGSSGGAMILESADTKFVMNGGEFIGNSGSYGGALYVSIGAIFEMNDGVFADNTATKNGGAMCLQNSTTTIAKGEIKNNSTAGGGGAIYLYEKTELTITGGTITGNTAKQGGALCATNQGVLHFVDGLITKNTSTGAGGGVILLNTGTKMTMSGGEISYNKGSTGGGIFVSTRTELEMTDGKIIYNTVKKHGGAIAMLLSKVTIRGGTISYNTCTDRDAQGAGIKLDGGNLTIYNVSMYGNRLTHKLNSGGAAIASYKGTETSNGVTKITNSKINMYGGTISNHTGRSGGSVQLLTETTFNMYGGTIRNSEAVLDGGAVAVYSKSSFNMYGGSIINNKSAKAGGGIYYGKGCTGVLTGGTATGNYCGTDGGFLHAYGLTTEITMKNMKIHGNEAKAYGGAVSMMMQSDLEMTDCELYENTANRGGAMYLAHKTTARVNDTKMYKNTVVEHGGAMYLDVGTTHFFTNVKFLDNTAGKSGGAILTRANVTFTDCLVDGNTAGVNGGGIATSSAWTYDHTYTGGAEGRGLGTVLKNTTISNNTCEQLGGGMFMNVKNWNTIEGSTFTGNTSGEGGSAIYVKDDLKVVGMTVTGNTSKNDGYAVWYDTNEYDGYGYTHGYFEMGGDVIVKDNQGGDMMLCENVVLSNIAEGYGQDTYFNVTLSDGILTNRVLGAYNYEGGELNYTVTYGTRSYDEPEYEAPKAEGTTTTEQTQKATSGNIWLYAGVGAFALAAIAAVVLIVLKKKKTPVAGKE